MTSQKPLADLLRTATEVDWNESRFDADVEMEKPEVKKLLGNPSLWAHGFTYGREYQHDQLVPIIGSLKSELNQVIYELDKSRDSHVREIQKLQAELESSRLPDHLHEIVRVRNEQLEKENAEMRELLEELHDNEIIIGMSLTLKLRELYKKLETFLGGKR